MGLIACLVLPLTLGPEVICLDPFRWVAKPLLNAIEEYRGTHVCLPNFAFLHLVCAVRRGRRNWGLSSIKAFVNCSEPCKPSAFDSFAERWREHGVTPGMLTCCYAMAETVFSVSQTRPGHAAARGRLDAESMGDIGHLALFSVPSSGIRCSRLGFPLSCRSASESRRRLRLRTARGRSVRGEERGRVGGSCAANLTLIIPQGGYAERLGKAMHPLSSGQP